MNKILSLSLMACAPEIVIEDGSTPEDVVQTVDTNMSCPNGQFYRNGECSCLRNTGLTMCNGVCLDLNTDNNNCGFCGLRCRVNEICRVGRCGCLSTTTMCGTTCSVLQSDNNNCGRCGLQCAGGQQCLNSVCQTLIECPAGLTQCGNICVNLQTDNSSCGTCGRLCAHNTGLICIEGNCVRR